MLSSSSLKNKESFEKVCNTAEKIITEKNKNLNK